MISSLDKTKSYAALYQERIDRELKKSTTDKKPVDRQATQKLNNKL